MTIAQELGGRQQKTLNMEIEVNSNYHYDTKS